MRVTSKVYRSFTPLNKMRKPLGQAFSDRSETIPTSSSTLKSQQYCLSPRINNNQQSKNMNNQFYKAQQKHLYKSKLEQGSFLQYQNKILEKFDSKRIISVQQKVEQTISLNCQTPIFSNQLKNKSLKTHGQGEKSPIQHILTKNNCQNTFSQNNQINKYSTQILNQQLTNEQNQKQQLSKLLSYKNDNSFKSNTIDIVQNNQIYRQVPLINAENISKIELNNNIDSINNLSSQLNIKQQKIRSLEYKISQLCNSINSLKVQHNRQINYKIKQNSKLKEKHNQLLNQLALLKSQNTRLINVVQYQNQQLNSMKSINQDINFQLKLLFHQKQYLQQTINTFNQILKYKVDICIIQKLKQQITQKQNKIIQIFKQNQLIVNQLNEIKQNNYKYLNGSQYFSLQNLNQFNVFESVLKTYIQDLQKYKSIVKQKNQQIEILKTQHNWIRIENQRLKNQLKIQEVRRITEIRNVDTILDVQRNNLMNQLKDVKCQLSLSKQKTKTLYAEIKSKDDFIQRNIRSPR